VFLTERIKLVVVAASELIFSRTGRCLEATCGYPGQSQLQAREGLAKLVVKLASDRDLSSSRTESRLAARARS
jgi:hypothetical protein